MTILYLPTRFEVCYSLSVNSLEIAFFYSILSNMGVHTALQLSVGQSVHHEFVFQRLHKLEI